MTYDEEVDLLVVGSGAGGFTAAVRAGQHGARVLIVEKGSLWGGTSATSGGGIWIPNSPVAAAAGHPDDPDDAFRYIRTLSSPNVADAQIDAFVKAAPVMLDWLTTRAEAGYVALPYPDYYPEVAGSRTGYRTHLPLDFDARRMARPAFDTMQRASPAASLWGRINWNMSETNTVLFRPKGWWKTMMRVMGRYWFDLPQRVRSARDRRLTLGTALLGRLRNAFDATGGRVWLDSPVTSLVIENGIVLGAVVRHEGRDVRIRATRGVVLAAGGFERNRTMRARHLRSAEDPSASGSQVWNTGDAIQQAVDIGVATRNLDSAWWAPTLRIPGEDRARLSTVERALPHSFMVDQGGRRFVNEALAYHRFGEVMAEANTTGAGTEPSWIIFDATYRARYPMGPVLPGIPDAVLPRAVRQTLVKADDLAALAVKIGVRADVFVATAERFNAMARAGKDEDFGRGDALYDRLYGDPRQSPNPSLGPVETGPFYAMSMYLGDIGTNGGIVTDGRGRALTEEGRIVPGLYAVGNCAASVMGYAYPGAGATLGPAMTFGYLAAGDAMGVNDDPVAA